MRDAYHFALRCVRMSYSCLSKDYITASLALEGNLILPTPNIDPNRCIFVLGTSLRFHAFTFCTANCTTSHDMPGMVGFTSTELAQN
jgi:hypothetical protein